MRRFINRYYFKFLRHRQEDIKRIVRSEIIQNTIKQQNITCEDCIVNSEFESMKTIISLTSFGTRVNSVYLAIESIAQQTIKPNEIVLWLAEDEFSNNNLPISIKHLIKRGLKVKYCKDIRSYKKLIPTLKKYPNDIIITIDDDCIYPSDFVEILLSKHQQNLDKIICNVARRISFKDGNLIAYNKWPHVNKESTIDKNLLPIGVNGILYPPNSFDNDVFDEATFMSLCPNADDIWFRLMALKNGIDICVTGVYPDHDNSFIPLDSSFIDDLAQKNVIKDENITQFKSVSDFYKIDVFK